MGTTPESTSGNAGYDAPPSDWLPSNARPPRERRTEPQRERSDASGVWEYKTIRVPNKNQRRAHDKALNKMADKGWELLEVKWGGLLRATNLATFRRPR